MNITVQDLSDKCLVYPQEEVVDVNDSDANTTKYLSVQEIIEMIYPVGSLYVSVNSVSPEALFGGKWEQIKDTFLLAAGDAYAAGDTGGEATHKLTVSEMPEHDHSITRLYTNYDRYYYATSNTSARIVYKSSSGVDTGSRGSSLAHNNMPPYTAVIVWKRIA